MLCRIYLAEDRQKSCRFEWLSACLYVFTCGWSIGGYLVYYLQRHSLESELSLALAGSHRWRRACCFKLHMPDWYNQDDPLGLYFYFDLRSGDEAEPTFYTRHRFYRRVPNPNRHVLFTAFSSFLRSTSAPYCTSSVILRAAQFRGGSVIYHGRVFFPHSLLT